MSQRPPCPFCGNLAFEEENGILVCTSCGRQQDGGLRIDEDDADFGTQGKITRKKVEKTKVKVTKVYHGAQAYRLYLQAWQHILWRQAYAFIHESAKAPSQLWEVVRDLWALRLTSLVKRLESNDSASGSGEANRQEITSTSEDDTENIGISKKPFLSPKLWDTISLVYLAAFLLRHPITIHQIYQLIRIEEMPFIRAIRHVPIDISSKLPSEYQLALDTTTIPTIRNLRQAICHTLETYATEFGMSFPSLNWRSVLYKWIQELGLPIFIYAVVKELAEIVSYDFSYHLASQRKNAETAANIKLYKHRRSPVAMAEVQLMSLIVVSVKLCFPFDVNGAVQDSSSDVRSRNMQISWPPIGLDWSSWLRVHQSHLTTTESPAQAKTIQPGKEIEVTDRDIQTMSTDDLDSYMNWYQRTFTTPETVLQSQRSDLEKSILDMFPLPDLPERSHPLPPTSTAITDRVSQFQSQVLRPAHSSPTQQQDSAPTPIPGSWYPIFSTPASLHVHEDQPDHENPILTFHARAAELACLDLVALLRAVRHTERKLETWAAEQRRDEVFGAQNEANEVQDE